MVKKSAPAFEAGSLGEWLEYLGADLSDADWVPMWPPDAFAIAAAFLRRTGGYVDLVNGERAHLPVPPVDAVIAAGKSWRRALDESFGAASTGKRFRHACPQEIRDAWREMRSHVRTPIAEARSFPSLTAAAVTLCTVADTACEGLGVSRAETPFLAMGEFLAEHQHQRRSYCMHIAPAKIAVLGKQHTPQRGCSIRSLTHNLSLYTPTEISAIWPAPLAKTQEEIDVFNVLMLPWPTEVADADFSIRPAAGLHRYFDYKPKPKPKTEVVKRVERAMDHAAQYVDRVHAVVLPELALHYPEYEAVERVVANRRAILVSGVRKDPCDDSQGLPSNTCAIQAYGLIAASDTRKRVTAKELVASRRTQFKHHRWCLDRRQIMQYGLGGRLPASRDCWEYAFIGPREIHFITLTSWLTISALICEDLARQEPVTEVLRAVGPNLIFALLMDGPQLKSRWASRYASVLAEDPGCSVLSVTSLGMSCRSKSGDPSAANDKSHTIALWRDAIYGEQEIALEQGHDACVLSLVCKTKKEYTIDGRSDGRHAHFPVFAGFTSFATPQKAAQRQGGKGKMVP